MTRKELNLRILELFPQLAKVEDWQWDETDEGEPVVMVESNATFTGLDDGSIDLTAPIPNTTLIGVGSSRTTTSRCWRRGTTRSSRRRLSRRSATKRPSRVPTRDTAWAMSEENVEAVRRGYEAINEFWRGELSSEDLLELLYVPEFEWSWHEGRRFPDEPQRLRGARAVLKFYEDMRDSLDELVIETHDYIEAPGDRVLVSCTHSGRGRESGVPFEVHYFQLWTVRRDGRAIKQELFRHRADALEAAGLRE